MRVVVTFSLQAGTQSEIPQGSLQLQRQHLAHGQELRDTCWRASERLPGQFPASRENPNADDSGTIALPLCDLGESTWHLKACFILIKGV